MRQAIAYGIVALFLASMVRSILQPDAMHVIMLAFVLASPVLLAVIAWHERT